MSQSGRSSHWPGLSPGMVSGTEAPRTGWGQDHHNLAAAGRAVRDPESTEKEDTQDFTKENVCKGIQV